MYSFLNFVGRIGNIVFVVVVLRFWQEVVVNYSLDKLAIPTV